MGTILERNVQFTVGKRTLQGVLHLPGTGGGPYPVVVGSHGLFADKTSPKQIALAKSCLSAGIAFFRFDHSGCGESVGDIASGSLLLSRSKDLAEALNLVACCGHIDRQKVGLFGSSLGGTVCLQCAGLIRGGPVVIWAAPVRSGPVTRSLQEADKTLPGRIPPELLRFDITGDIRVSNILVFHAEKDEVVPVSNAHHIFSRARYPKQLQIFSNGDHRMNNPVHQQIFMRESVNWYRRHFYPGR